MSVLNRSMFNKQIVNREEGSPLQGEQPSTTFFQKLFDGATGLGTGVGPYGDKEQGNILDLREYGAGVYDITDPQFVEFIKNYHQGDGTFEEGIQTYVNSLKTVERAEGSPIGGEQQGMGEQQGIMNALLEAIKNMSSDSVVREGEMMNMMDPRLRQMGSPPQGEMIEEQVDVENVGIMDGFSDGEGETAEAILQEGERSKKEIDDADTYDELMRSVRGDDLSEAERRQELASVVGEKDAEETPDSVLALVQPVLQMLNEDTANTGIGQIEEGQEMANVMPTQAGATDVMAMMMPERPVGVANGGYMSSFPNQNLNTESLSASDNIDDRIMQNLQFERMAPGMMGYAEGGLVQQYASGGDVRRVPKYNTGTSSLGVTPLDTYLSGDTTVVEEEVEEPYDTTTTDFLTQILSPEAGQSALKTKYDTNYKLFSEILGGQGPSKDEKIGEILTSVVSPLAFQYAQGADIQELLAAGTKAIGKISQKYSAQERKNESEIRSAALAQALKPAPDDPLVTVFLQDDPNTPENESIRSIQITTSQLKTDALRPIGEKLYSANSTALALAELGKLESETKEINIDTAIKQIEYEYKDILLGLEADEKAALVDGRLITNTINQAIASNKPALLAAELKNIDLNNIEKKITNDTLRPTLEAELEKSLINIDIATQDLKQEIIETKYAKQLKDFEGEKLQAEIDLLVQKEDFNENNNVLLLEEKKAQINNIILTGKNLDLQNEFDTITNSFLEGKLKKEDEILALDIINKQLDNVLSQIEVEFSPTEKQLKIDEIKNNMKLVNEQILIAETEGDMNKIKLENFESKEFLALQEAALKVEKLQDEIDNPPKDWKKIELEDAFRNKWEQLGVVKNMEERYGFMKNLMANASLNTGAGDIAVIFQYMKMLDPRSVVRENEVAQVENAGGVPDNIRNLYNKTLTGVILPDAVRQQILEAAFSMYENQQKIYDETYDQYRKIAASPERDFNLESAIPYFQGDLDLNVKMEQLRKIEQLARNKDDDAAFIQKQGYNSMNMVWDDKRNTWVSP